MFIFNIVHHEKLSVGLIELEKTRDKTVEGGRTGDFLE